MNGWLIYDEEGAKRNEWFINRLIRSAEKQGVSLQLKIFRDGWRLDLQPLPEIAVVRTINPALSKRLETLGVRCVNNAETSRVANDKWQTYLACKQWGIPVLDTWQYPSIDREERYPLVLKATDGHGGKEVFWAEDREKLQKLSENLPLAEKKYILQTPCKTLGKDMRAYAIGGEIVACVLRESEKDFRSNFSLGGKVRAVEADETQKAIVKKLYEKLRFDYVGVDFLPDGKSWVLNEIEDSAGARMLYECTALDVAELFARHLRSLKNG